MSDLPLPTADRERIDGVRYHELLRPSPWLWLMALGAGLFLGAAYGFALGPIAGAVTAAAVCGIGCWITARRFVRVSVDDGSLRAGRASLPARYIGRVRALDQAATAQARGPGADANAYLVLRMGYAKSAVAVEVADPADPHSYWLISSRRPEALASAIMSMTAGDRTHRPT